MAMSNLPILTLFLVLGAAITLTEAQVPSCASKLVPCVDYLNSTTKPPDTCCSPLKEAVANEMECLCNLYSDPALLKAFNISVPAALRLTTNCGINSDLSACANIDGSPTGSVTPPPPGQAGGNSGAEKITWTGVSGLLLVMSSVLLY